MFNLGEFVKGGLLKAIGNMADYQIILNAVGWHEKGVLTTDDLAEIQNAIAAREETADTAEAIDEAETGEVTA